VGLRGCRLKRLSHIVKTKLSSPASSSEKRIEPLKEAIAGLLKNNPGSTTKNQEVRTPHDAEGLFQNNHGVTVPVSTDKECDPESEDPDVGFLSCGSDYECAVDEASALGGYCKSTTRQLQEEFVCPAGDYVYCDLCGRGMWVDPEVTGDIVWYESADGQTTFTCNDLFLMAALPPAVLTEEDCLGTIRVVAQMYGCCVPNDCPQTCESGSFDICGVVPLETSYVLCLAAEHSVAVAVTLEGADCESANSLLAPYCCEGSFTSPPTLPSPTFMPVVPPTTTIMPVVQPTTTITPIIQTPTIMFPGATAVPAIPVPTSSDAESMWSSPQTLLVSMMWVLAATVAIGMSFY